GAGASLTVSPTTASAYRLIATTTTPTAGVANALTIALVDQYQNVESSGPNAFSGTKTLTFAGLNTAPDGTHVPTVTNNASTPVNLGGSPTITFTNGLNTAGGSLVAYKAETATLTASDSGSISTFGTGGTGATLVVSPAAANAYRITAANNSP